MKPPLTTYPKDSAGVTFDPVIHQTNRDGSPRTTKTGRYFARGGIAAPRAEARAPRPETPHVPHVQKAVPPVQKAVTHVPAPHTPHAAPVPAARTTAPTNAPKAVPTATPADADTASSGDIKKGGESGPLETVFKAVTLGSLGILALMFTGQILKPAR